MHIGPQYDADLLEFKTKTENLKSDCFSLMNLLNKYDRAALDTAGYTGKTNAEAMQMAFQAKQNQLLKLTREFLKKYPD